MTLLIFLVGYPLAVTLVYRLLLVYKLKFFRPSISNLEIGLRAVIFPFIGIYKLCSSFYKLISKFIK